MGSKLDRIGVSIQDLLEREVDTLTQAAADGAFGHEQSERLGRTVTMLGKLEAQARVASEHAAKQGAELNSEDAIRALCQDIEFRRLLWKILQETVTGEE